MILAHLFFFVVGNWTVVPLGTPEWDIVTSSISLPHTHPPFSNLVVIHYYFPSLNMLRFSFELIIAFCDVSQVLLLILKYHRHACLVIIICSLIIGLQCMQRVLLSSSLHALQAYDEGALKG